MILHVMKSMMSKGQTGERRGVNGFQLPWFDLVYSTLTWRRLENSIDFQAASFGIWTSVLLRFNTILISRYYFAKISVVSLLYITILQNILRANLSKHSQHSQTIILLGSKREIVVFTVPMNHMDFCRKTGTMNFFRTIQIGNIYL